MVASAAQLGQVQRAFGCAGEVDARVPALALVGGAAVGPAAAGAPRGELRRDVGQRPHALGVALGHRQLLPCVGPGVSAPVSARYVPVRRMLWRTSAPFGPDFSGKNTRRSPRQRRASRATNTRFGRRDGASGITDGVSESCGTRSSFGPHPVAPPGLLSYSVLAGSDGGGLTGRVRPCIATADLLAADDEAAVLLEVHDLAGVADVEGDPCPRRCRWR